MTSALKDIVVIAATRTPMGKFGGAFQEMPVYQLGGVAIRETLLRSRIPLHEVSDVLLGCCRHAGNGTNPARTAARFAGLPGHIPAATVTMACASGMRSVIQGVQSILCGDAELVVCGGMENMSTIPYLLPDLRWNGLRHGHKTLYDGWTDSRDPFIEHRGAGITTEKLVTKYNIDRKAQDQYALESHRSARNASLKGLFDEEIVPVPVNGNGKPGAPVTRDETIREETSREKLSVLPPVFIQNGTLTAGNSSPFADGAAVLAVTHRQKASQLGAAPLFSILSYATGAVENDCMGEGPAHVLPLALRNARLTLKDVDFIELNEAFAGMALVNERLLKLDRGKLNKNGGAIALGHPVGASGARILVTLYYILKHFDAEIGAAVIGAAGGVCTTMIIKRE